MAESTELRVFSAKYIEWEIPKFFDLPKKQGYYLKSPTFYLDGSRQKWWLQILPNDNSSTSSAAFVILRLFKEASATTHRVAFRMGIRNTDGSEFKSDERKETFTTKEDYWGVCFRRAELNSAKADIASGGTLTVFCRATIMDEQTMFSPMESATHIPLPLETGKYLSQKSSSKTTVEVASQTSSLEGVSILIENFKDLYLNKRSADIKIIVKGREFLAHTHILIARSKVLSSMFSNDMVEKNSGIVEITDCDPNSFEHFLLFLYTGNLEVVSSRNATSLYETADKYDLKELKEECVRCMISEMNLDSFCDVLHLADMYNETDVLMAVTNFFIANAKRILLTPQWTNFMAENLSLGNELVLKFVDKHTNSED